VIIEHTEELVEEKAAQNDVLCVTVEGLNHKGALVILGQGECGKGQSHIVCAVRENNLEGV